jgi:hypothetical protein
MTNGIKTIKKTTDYASFKTVKGNRLLNQEHYKHLLSAVNRKNLLSLNPIIVNEEMQVIDGQHRLEVAKALNVPVYYVVGDDLDIEDVIMFNTAVKGWKIDDYAQTFVQLGYEDYIKLAQFKNKWHISTSNSIAILSSETKRIKEAGYKKFKQGQFEIVDYDWANEFARRLHDVVPFTSENTWKDREFIQALSLIYDKGVDHDTLVDRLQRYGQPMYRRATMTEYLRLFEDIYNKGLTPANSLRFY